MDAINLVYQVQTRVRNLTQVNVGAFLHTSVIESFLNEAQDLVVRKYIELFDVEPESRVYLGKLLKGVKFTAIQAQASTATSTGFLFNVPSDLRLPMMERVLLTNTATSISKVVRVKDVSGTHIELNSSNPFKKPYEDMVWRTELGKSTIGGSRVFQIIIPINFTFQEYYLDYVAYTTEISVSNNTSSLLEESVHNELIDKAVELLLKSHQFDLKSNT